VNFEALACDYDGTLAHDGVVTSETVEALRGFRASGRKLLLVTGRRLDDLFHIFEHPELFDRIVAENGAVLFRPAGGECLDLCTPPPGKFVAALRNAGVQPLEVGHVIIATHEPQETLVLQLIHSLGLELQVIFNKGAVMVLPTGVNKATGLKQALKELGLAPEAVVAVGDAENDHAFFDFCGLSVAVANALPAVREHADVTMTSSHGAGVEELIRGLLAGTFRSRRESKQASG
jgi:hydroxymethylpyrimidine pyrophosphatase-like HAD family hydrolase